MPRSEVRGAGCGRRGRPVFRSSSIVGITAACAFALMGAPRAARPQGIASSAIYGTVVGSDGSSADGAIVRVTHTATGFFSEARVRRQRFTIHGLEPGGPYIVDVRRIGFLPIRTEPVMLSLGRPLALDFVMTPAPAPLEVVQVTASSATRAGGGSVTIVGEKLVQGLPTLNRNFLDFVALAPQVSTKIGFGRSGVSAAGANLRFNNFLVNGAEERFVNGSVSAAHNIGKSVPLDAVREYEVLVAPYDVRYGDFAGALINTVTHSGTNEFRATTFGYWLSDRLGRAGPGTSGLPYERSQAGFMLSGPLVRDRLHFLLAPEFQRASEPAAGPYLGRAGPQIISDADLTRLQQIMEQRYGLAVGSAGPVINETPLRNVLVRLDAALPALNSRAVGFMTYSDWRGEQFSRTALSDTFALSSSQFATESGLRMFSLQLYSDVPRFAAHNELVVSFSSDWFEQVPVARQPVVRVWMPRAGGGSTLVTTGAPEQAHGVFRRASAVKLRDEVTFPWRDRHVLTLGAQLERFTIRPGGVNGAYGSWTFASLDALESGAAERYELRKDFGSTTNGLTGWQDAVYAGDAWSVGDRLRLTLGIRGDRMRIDGHAPYNALIDSIFGRRTDVMPRPRVHFSPRLGFSWDVRGSERHYLRGGAGVFTGRPPLAWITPAIANYGVGTGLLRCGFLPGDRGEPPEFVPDFGNPPLQCATGAPLAGAPDGDVDLLDRNLRLAQALRGSLAYVRRLPGNMTLTTEVVGSRYVSDFMFVNLNLPQPRGTDRFGRVIYGTINLNGVTDSVARSRFAQVIDLTNTSRNYSYQLSARFERTPVAGIGGVVSYTYSRTRDVQSPSRVNQRGIVMWADARATSSRHDDLTTSVSLNDLPHRMVLAATYAMPRLRWSRSLGLYYVGESGSPFTYVATGPDRRRGDLNADGSNANDPIYVPRSAFDSGEILFQTFDTVTAARQAEAFERFIERSACLRRQRGQILRRNSCREPWSHTTVAALRQAVPLGQRALEAELSLFNVLNLLKESWGHYRLARPAVLQHVAHTGLSIETAQPVFRFDPARPQWETRATESTYQLQFALRMRF